MPSGKQGFSEMGNSKCTLCIVKCFYAVREKETNKQRRIEL